MEKLNFGDVVLLKFPFTDNKNYKKRPGLLIKDSEDGDIIVCRITSQSYHTKYDILINDWQNSGLKLPSTLRVHKIATLEKEMVVLVMGKLNNIIKAEVSKIFATIIE
jgi:mRNA interferase MazF